MHRKLGTSELEEICRGTKDSEVIKHRNRRGSGSGLWDNSGRERPGGARRVLGLRLFGGPCGIAGEGKWREKRSGREEKWREKRNGKKEREIEDTL